MSMTVDEIEECAGRIRGQLADERRRVRQGEYRSGVRPGDLRLIAELDGRLDDLLAQCALLRAQAGTDRPAA